MLLKTRSVGRGSQGLSKCCRQQLLQRLVRRAPRSLTHTSASRCATVAAAGLQPHICVVGGGVAGLTTALRLLQELPGACVQVYAEAWGTGARVSAEHTCMPAMTATASTWHAPRSTCSSARKSRQLLAMPQPNNPERRVVQQTGTAQSLAD